MPLRVLIAEDYPFFRRMMRQVLATDPTVEIVAEEEDPQEIIGSIQALTPNVVLLDTSLPQTNGLELADAILLESPRVRVILMGDEEMPDYHVVAKEHGISAYLLKRDIEQDLLETLQSVSATRMDRPEERIDSGPEL